jgi:DNA repair photolyase
VKIGITERGDAGLDLSWKTGSFDGAILITKSPSDKFINEVSTHPLSDKLIVHFTCTGYGGTALEPNVPPISKVKGYMEELLKTFNKNRIILRVDPIIPTRKGLLNFGKVLSYFKNSGVSRIRYSFLDMYPHVKDRFVKEGMSLPYATFKPGKFQINNTLKIINKWENLYSFESCAENTPHKMGCISAKDITLMKLNPEKLTGLGNQRKSCLCPSNKIELLKNARRCKSGCLYCYWKD